MEQESSPSLFSPSFRGQEKKQKNDLRKYLLKTYLEKLKNEDKDEITRLLQKVISSDKIDSMSDSDIRDSVKILTMVQNILDDSFEYEHLFTTSKVLLKKVEGILKKKYPQYYDVINTTSYNLKRMFERLSTIKNRHINKLVFISSLNLENCQKHQQLPDMKWIIGSTVIQTVVFSLIYGVMESFDDIKTEPIDLEEVTKAPDIYPEAYASRYTGQTTEGDIQRDSAVPL